MDGGTLKPVLKRSFGWIKHWRIVKNDLSNLSQAHGTVEGVGEMDVLLMLRQGD